MLRFHAAFCLAWSLHLALPAQADVIYKKNGGKLTGTILAEESTAERLTIRTRFGTFKILRKDVEKVDISDDPVPQYEEESKKYRQTAQDQFRLALWCSEHDFHQEYKEHLRKVIELDPNHEDARKRLGFTKSGGKWMTRQDFFVARGYVEYKGRFVLPQEKEDLLAKEAQSQKRKAFYRKIRLWQGWLRKSDEQRQAQARKELLAIRDPAAIEPLIAYLGENGEEDERNLLVEILEKIPNSQATSGLVNVALEDEASRNRSRAAQALLPRKTPELVLGISKYLQDKENQKVANAGSILAEVGDSSVVPALIDALVTRHVHTYEPTILDHARNTLGFSYKPKQTIVLPDGTMIRRNTVGPYGPVGQGTGGISVSGQATKQTIVEERKNVSVLRALVKLTGKDFGYDKDEWLTWLEESYRRKAAKLTN